MSSSMHPAHMYAHALAAGRNQAPPPQPRPQPLTWTPTPVSMAAPPPSPGAAAIPVNPAMMGHPGLMQPPGPAQLGSMGGMGMPPGFTPSDARMKTDIKEVGRLMLPGGEVPISTYRFTGDPVRRMGLIAQHVEKVDPQSVHTHPRTGVKGVNYARVLLGAHQHAMGGGNGVGRAS